MRIRRGYWLSPELEGKLASSQSESEPSPNPESANTNGQTEPRVRIRTVKVASLVTYKKKGLLDFLIPVFALAFSLFFSISRSITSYLLSFLLSHYLIDSLIINFLYHNQPQGNLHPTPFTANPYCIIPFLIETRYNGRYYTESREKAHNLPVDKAF